MIIIIPDPDAVRGFITRLSPHWVHILYYKYIYSWAKNAGKPGYAPYYTYKIRYFTERSFSNFVSKMD